jgi:anti-sigma factor RsiW
MTLPHDEVTDQDIEAFLLGRIDPDRRISVALHMERNPHLAMQVMTDLRLQEDLRAALARPDGPPPPGLSRTAGQLSRRLAPARRWPMRLAAACALIALGWSGQVLWTNLQEVRMMSGLRPLAETALDAQAAVDLQRSLALSPPRRDATEIAARLGLALPVMPADWEVRDAQVVATPDHPGLAVVIDTPDMGEVMLLSFRQDDDGTITPLRAFDHRGSAVAVFEHGPAAYVLVDAQAGERAALSRGAERLLLRLN